MAKSKGILDDILGEVLDSLSDKDGSSGSGLGSLLEEILDSADAPSADDLLENVTDFVEDLTGRSNASASSTAKKNGTKKTSSSVKKVSVTTSKKTTVTKKTKTKTTTSGTKAKASASKKKTNS